MVYYLIAVLHVLVCIILILVVLLQSGKGADLAGVVVLPRHQETAGPGRDRRPQLVVGGAGDGYPARVLDLAAVVDLGGESLLDHAPHVVGEGLG